MLHKEKMYEFKEKMLEVHKKDIRDYSLMPNSDEYVINDGALLVIDKNASDVVLTAARDFIDYLFDSQGVSVRLKKGTMEEADIYVGTKAETGFDLKDADSYKGFLASVSDKIIITGYDDRGAAQGLYFLESEMNLRRAPYLTKKETVRKPLFSPRMVHSGFSIDDYPDAHLNAIAHSGRDAILVFVKDVNITTVGFLDFNNLIYRAKKYGIDVYAYSYLKMLTHPDEPNADAAFESTYGKLFKNCPGLKGVTLVGESVRFASRDPNAKDIIKNSPTDSRTDPGWWPCLDYADWLVKVRDTVRKYNPEADIVFWTYNWSGAPEEHRIALIKRLPKDVSLLVTYEMGTSYPLYDATQRTTDYNLAFAGPGTYFLSEAKAAKECGIKLYSMTNTGGLTWDIGTIPYEPFPYQWMERYKGMLEAHEKYGLCGLMESHHFGFYPSFIGDFSNLALSDTEKSMEENLKYVLSIRYGDENKDILCEALKLWSEAIKLFTPSHEDQYGAFRIGPAYPFLFTRYFPTFKIPEMPYAHFGARIVDTDFPDHDDCYPRLGSNRIGIRMPREIKALSEALRFMREGTEIMEKIENKNEELERLINLGKYIEHTIVSGINIKRWALAKWKYFASDAIDTSDEYFKELEGILEEEYKNAEETIPLVEVDSRLGWEPSMEYIGHKDNILWKLNQLKFVRDVQIPRHKKRSSSQPY